MISTSKIISRLPRRTRISIEIPQRSFSEEAPESSKGDRITNILTKAVDTRPRPRPDFSLEEAAKNYQIGRDYNIGRFKVHNDIHHDLACKIRLKEHAIRMMPRNTDELGYLRMEALKIDSSPESMPPLYRSIPFDTPPIEGYDASQFLDEDED
jgi:hypothetical protein